MAEQSGKSRVGPFVFVCHLREPQSGIFMPFNEMGRTRRWFWSGDRRPRVKFCVRIWKGRI
jgi:hypothetical protein